MIHNKAVILKLLKESISNNTMDVFYQPQIDIEKNEIVGVEALARLRHPFGWHLPNSFLLLAKENGFSILLDRQIIEKAFLQFGAWKKIGINPQTISVNITMSHLENGDFLEFLINIISGSGCLYSDVELEITEDEMAGDFKAVVNTLIEIRNLGVLIAVDDFGTGYSSLSYLKHLPVSKVKIDKSFIKDLSEDSKDSFITGAIVVLARALNLKVIAEGVETKTQNTEVLKSGCNIVQGFYYSKAVHADEMTKLLGLNNKRT